MSPLVERLAKFDNALAKGEGWVLMGLVTLMTIVVFLQVVCRYFLVRPLHWSEELARYLFVWISLLGATLSVHRHALFGMDFLFRMLPARWRRFLALLIYLLMEVVVVVLLVQGMVLVQKTLDQHSPAMEIPMGWAYACLPMGASLMGIHLLVIILRKAREKPERR
jgi:TRAP-type transport system small permease protein